MVKLVLSEGFSIAIRLHHVYCTSDMLLHYTISLSTSCVTWGAPSANNTRQRMTSVGVRES
jgi:hypothetical protein